MANKKITELTELTAANIANNDVLAIVDVGGDETKKVAISSLHDIFDTNATIATAKIIYGLTGANTNISELSVNTLPLIGEGNQYMNVSITPQSASNILVVQHQGWYSDSMAGGGTIAMFAGNTCVGTSQYEHPTGSLHSGGDVDPLSATATFVAGTTSALVITIRGSTYQQNATLTFNGKGGARRFGATQKSSLIVTEYTP